MPVSKGRRVGHASTPRSSSIGPSSRRIPRCFSTTKVMEQVVGLAYQCDAAVVAVGIEEGEFRDRASLSLPGRQEELIQRVSALEKPMVVILIGGSAITMPEWLPDVPAVLDAWYPGEQGGAALARVLFGDINPAGRLPIAFPQAEGQLPLVYNLKSTGRGDDYVDLSGRPLFPFGYGLSYTTFIYSRLVIEPDTIRAGEEVVQLHIRDEIASVARPVAALKGFQRVYLEPNESQDLGLVIEPEMPSMLSRDLQPVEEAGEFQIRIGASSQDIRLKGVLVVLDR